MSGAPVTWRALLAEGTERLTGAGLASPSVDARWIVEAVSGWAGSDRLEHLDDRVTVRNHEMWETLVARRAGGEPLQYVLASWAFRSLDLYVDRRVLIPRPETEVVAGHALAEVDRLRTDRPAVVVDLGTGSGAIGLAIAAERAGRVEVVATDVSPDALDVARANLAGLGHAGGAVTLVEGSWFDALPAERRGGIDVVVSNPPYVADSDALPADVRDWEPVGALLAGATGLEAIEVIVTGAPHWLARPGALVVEIGETQGNAVVALARTAGFAEVGVHPDLAGKDRILVARI